MCPSCDCFAERRTFKAPEDYVAFVRQLISQADNGKMLVVYGNCALGELKDAPPWPTGDVIVHQLQCADCGQYFHLSANVWNGRNSWEMQTAEEWNSQKPYYIKE